MFAESLMCPRDYEYLIHILSSCWIFTMIQCGKEYGCSILQMRKLKLTGIKGFSQGHTALIRGTGTQNQVCLQPQQKPLGCKGPEGTQYWTHLIGKAILSGVEANLFHGWGAHHHLSHLGRSQIVRAVKKPRPKVNKHMHFHIPTLGVLCC